MRQWLTFVVYFGVYEVIDLGSILTLRHIIVYTQPKWSIEISWVKLTSEVWLYIFDYLQICAVNDNQKKKKKLTNIKLNNNITYNRTQMHKSKVLGLLCTLTTGPIHYLHKTQEPRGNRTSTETKLKLHRTKPIVLVQLDSILRFGLSATRNTWHTAHGDIAVI